MSLPLIKSKSPVPWPHAAMLVQLYPGALLSSGFGFSKSHWPISAGIALTGPAEHPETRTITAITTLRNLLYRMMLINKPTSHVSAWLLQYTIF